MRCASCGARRAVDVGDAADATPACDACGDTMVVTEVRTTEVRGRRR
jgi:hypothetical protein